SPCRQALRHKAALCPDRHDDGVLHSLRLGKAQDLGAKILWPVRPSQASARHWPAAQMHAFEVRRIDEYLGEGPGLGQSIDLLAIELEGDDRRVLIRPALAEEVRPQHRADKVDEAADDLVLIEARDVAQGLFDSCFDLFRLLAIGILGI